jgi:transposase
VEPFLVDITAGLESCRPVNRSVRCRLAFGALGGEEPGVWTVGVAKRSARPAAIQAALCYGVGGGGAQLAFHVTAGNYDTDTLIEVLGQLRRFLGGEKATLLWDGLPAHRSRAMRAWLNTQRHWLVVERLPAYAPELNPTEGLWSSLKAVELANLTAPALAEAIAQAHKGIERVRRTPHLAYSFLRHAGLSVS